jgi:hypothetical protein
MALITEMVKNFFAPHNRDNSKKSSIVNPEQMIQVLTDLMTFLITKVKWELLQILT